MRIRGFTLLEMVITIVISAILILGIAGFIELGTKGYAQSADRQAMQTQARFALEKITREARHAVPNIFVADGNCLSFYPIIDSGFYAVSGSDINFIIGNSTADVDVLNDQRLVINPTQLLAPSENLTDLDNSFALTDVVKISGATISGATFTIPDVAEDLLGGSVVNRHYITADARRISYCIAGERITRTVGLSGDALPLTDISDVSVSGAISYTPASVQYTGVVHLDLTFSQRGESTRFQQDVQVLNVP
ncbi:prepilin-type N-terminal cleavage/methylation domain-containing protein [Vibrio ponticus]|uniref:Prepilin-type N-terminal cleavage/methylation domain-containing protein n=1 Tax=Vibrio ponticus TaxID=265668 RepID=A0A3N3E5J4_9VIBR|nr:prepilin-type N-terminal cleavage/methylation domain-containing protein [Vibrio ponticus]ROV61869.1 prepilin-type N-terminal cleavage/methylation domain-containing protein [Vibrio ponticus]